jgi:hypothetical protein
MVVGRPLFVAVSVLAGAQAYMRTLPGELR